MNKDNGNIGLAIKINFHDNWEESHEAAQLVDAGKAYSVGFRPAECDGWMIFNGAPEEDGPWVFMNSKPLDEKIEVLCEL